ncbi:MAG: hypothetical protein WA021_05720 [Minisyncoccia bacterium]
MGRAFDPPFADQLVTLGLRQALLAAAIAVVVTAFIIFATRHWPRRLGFWE